MFNLAVTLVSILFLVIGIKKGQPQKIYLCTLIQIIVAVYFAFDLNLAYKDPPERNVLP